MSDTSTSVFPFVVGAGRSGTTLLRAILDSHPRLAVAHESHFFAEMLQTRERYETDGSLNGARFLEDLAREAWLERHGLSLADVEEELASRPASNVPDAIRRVFEAYARARGKPLYGNKTPDHVLHLPQIAAAFPDARFVHIVRDGRDVALSLLDTGWGPRNVGEAALFWSRHVLAGRDAGAELPPGRYVEVSYEALVGDAERTVGDVCRFLGLAMDERMLHYYERAEEIVAAAKQPAIHARISLPPTKGLRDWRTAMGPSDVALFEALAGDTLEELGYERAFAEIPRRGRLRARWHGIARRLPTRRGVARRVAAAVRR
jgi:Sulfotransferase family